jgi:hypothetical protein
VLRLRPPVARTIGVVRCRELSTETREAGANRITTAALREELTYIASDELAGRDTPSPGLEKAAEYIEQRLERAGIEPAGDGGTYRQTIPLQQYRRDPSATAAQFAGRNLTLAKDYITPENPILAGSASGALVYVGSGFILKRRASTLTPTWM